MVSKLVWHLSDTSNHSTAFPPSDPLSAACWCFFQVISASWSQQGCSSFRLHICVPRGEGKPFPDGSSGLYSVSLAKFVRKFVPWPFLPEGQLPPF